MGIEFVKRWGYMVAVRPSRPGIYRLQQGGYLLRARVTNPKDPSKRPAKFRVLPEASLQEAQAEYDAIVQDLRDNLKGCAPKRQRFTDFVVSRFEVKVLDGTIKSAKGRLKIEGALRVHILPTFGAMACEDIRTWHAEQWRTALARKIADGYASARRLRNGQTFVHRLRMHPGTANTLISIFKTFCAEMKDLLELDVNPAASLRPFDTSQRPTYTDESPNTLAADQAREFLSTMQRMFPQHYAMTLLGFVTGKRPSTLRPLRVAGDRSDVDWREGFIRFRRSHTVGNEFMEGTKTGTRERVYLPEAVMAALRIHRAYTASPPLSARGKPPLWWRAPMAESDLLFPGRNGKARSPSCLDKPFLAVSRAMGLPFELTPRAMRRTCNDLCRAAEVDEVVTRSITGHLTGEMRIRYSTARASEQRAAIAKVIDLVALKRPA